MAEVEYTNEFGGWWTGLDESQQEDLRAYVVLLQESGPHLPFPYSSKINGSRHGQMRELRGQSGGHPLRVFYAFDPRRCAILLIGGDKTGNDRFYQQYVPIADKLYDEHLAILAKENQKDQSIMAGRHPFSELEAKMSPAAQARSNEKARKLRREMDLAQIRQAVKLTQEELAATMNIGQAAVAKIERRSDLYLSTVRRFINAMGGELLLIARFPDREIEINTLRLPSDEMDQ